MVVQGLGLPVTKRVGVIAGQQVLRRPVILVDEYARCKTRPRARQAHDNRVSGGFHTNDAKILDEHGVARGVCHRYAVILSECDGFRGSTLTSRCGAAGGFHLTFRPG